MPADKLIMAEESQNVHTEISFTSDQRENVMRRLSDPNVVFFFIPSAILREFVTQGQHPGVQQFPDIVIKGILFGNTIRLTNDIVVKYVEKTLEEPWKFMLANGDIRVKDLRDGFVLKSNIIK